MFTPPGYLFVGLAYRGEDQWHFIEPTDGTTCEIAPNDKEASGTRITMTHLRAGTAQHLYDEATERIIELPLEPTWSFTAPNGQKILWLVLLRKRTES